MILSTQGLGTENHKNHNKQKQTKQTKFNKTILGLHFQTVEREKL